MLYVRLKLVLDLYHISSSCFIHSEIPLTVKVENKNIFHVL